MVLIITNKYVYLNTLLFLFWLHMVGHDQLVKIKINLMTELYDGWFPRRVMTLLDRIPTGEMDFHKMVMHSVG